MPGCEPDSGSTTSAATMLRPAKATVRLLQRVIGGCQMTNHVPLVPVPGTLKRGSCALKSAESSDGSLNHGDRAHVAQLAGAPAQMYSCSSRAGMNC